MAGCGRHSGLLRQPRSRGPGHHRQLENTRRGGDPDPKLRQGALRPDCRFPPPKGYTVRSTPDLNNKDQSKQQRKILGLKVLWRLKPASDGWKGRVYDPRRGFSANATVRRTGATSLEVQGCVRVVFNVCEKETWRKVN